MSNGRDSQRTHRSLAVVPWSSSCLSVGWTMTSPYNLMHKRLAVGDRYRGINIFDWLFWKQNRTLTLKLNDSTTTYEGQTLFERSRWESVDHDDDIRYPHNSLFDSGAHTHSLSPPRTLDRILSYPILSYTMPVAQVGGVGDAIGPDQWFHSLPFCTKYWFGASVLITLVRVVSTKMLYNKIHYATRNFYR